MNHKHRRLGGWAIRCVRASGAMVQRHWRASLMLGVLLVISGWDDPAYALGEALPELDIYADSFPPFVRLDEDHLTGPWIQAFAWLVRAQGMLVHFHAMPQQALLAQIQGQPGSCGLGVAYSAGVSETVRYVGRIAPVTLALYARRYTLPHINQLSALRGYRLAAVNEPELVRRLDQAGLTYQTVEYGQGRGMDLLLRGEVDALISDMAPARLGVPGGTRAFERQSTLLQAERWLVCNPVMPVPALNRLRTALREGVFASETEPFWIRYGLGDYFRQVRALWMEGPPSAQHP